MSRNKIWPKSEVVFPLKIAKNDLKSVAKTIDKFANYVSLYRFTWSMKTTSSMDAFEMVKEIIKVYIGYISNLHISDCLMIFADFDFIGVGS